MVDSLKNTNLVKKECEAALFNLDRQWKDQQLVVLIEKDRIEALNRELQQKMLLVQSESLNQTEKKI